MLKDYSNRYMELCFAKARLENERASLHQKKEEIATQKRICESVLKTNGEVPATSYFEPDYDMELYSIIIDDFLTNQIRLQLNKEESNYLETIINNASNIDKDTLLQVITYLISVIENKEYEYIGNYKVKAKDEDVLDIRLLPYVTKFINSLTDFKAYKASQFGYPSTLQLTYEELYNLANQFLDEEISFQK